jgi:hypothetical protein
MGLEVADPAPAATPPQPADALSPVLLDYAHRLPPRRPKLHAAWRAIVDSGPIFPRPSLLTLALLLACAGATWWLAQRPQPWRLVRSSWNAQTNGNRPNVQYLPDRDAIIFFSSAGTPRIANPWTDETLLDLEPMPTSQPPNPPPGRSGEVSWMEMSADGSRVLAAAEIGTFVWDTHTGRIVAGWPSYSPAVWASILTNLKPRPQPPNDLGPDALDRLPQTLGALSPDGSRVCVINLHDELLLYDLSNVGDGKAATLLARHTLRPKLRNDQFDLYRSYSLRFSPDGQSLLAVGPGVFWVGDANL